MSVRSTVQIGELPPLGQMPERMLAQVIRQNRFGDPRGAFQIEAVPVPSLQPDQVLILSLIHISEPTRPY